MQHLGGGLAPPCFAISFYSALASITVLRTLVNSGNCGYGVTLQKVFCSVASTKDIQNNRLQLFLTPASSNPAISLFSLQMLLKLLLLSISNSRYYEPYIIK